MNNLLLALKLSCRDVSPLISEMMDHTLPWHNRMRVKLHLGICKLCRCYQDQLEKLRALSLYLGREETPVHENHCLSSKQKESIKLSLKNQC